MRYVSPTSILSAKQESDSASFNFCQSLAFGKSRWVIFTQHQTCIVRRAIIYTNEVSPKTSIKNKNPRLWHIIVRAIPLIRLKIASDFLESVVSHHIASFQLRSAKFCAVLTMRLAAAPSEEWDDQIEPPQ